jgi:hypothetical protein
MRRLGTSSLADGLTKLMRVGPTALPLGFYLRPLDNRHARPRMTGSDDCNQADFDQISNMAQPVITLFCCRMQLLWLKEYHD